jgi:hypothetical protein
LFRIGQWVFQSRINRLPAATQNSAKKPPMAAGLGVTRHPGAGAAQQLSVAGGEPQRNEEFSSLAAVFWLPQGTLLIRQARLHKPPFPHIRWSFSRRPGAVRGAERRSGPLAGRAAARSFERGKGGPSFSFLTARFADEPGARFGRRALERRGDRLRRRARDRAGCCLCFTKSSAGRGGPLCRLHNAALSETSSAACGVCDPKGCFG